MCDYSESERLRVEAEKGRVSAEEDRIDAEGGRRADCRVKAETSRVRAEANREHAEKDRRVAGAKQRAEWRRSGTRLLWTYLGVFLILTIAMTIQSCGIKTNTEKIAATQKALTKTQDEQFTALQGSCRRVNTLRSNDNRNAVVQYDTLILASQLVVGDPVKSKFIALAKSIDYVPRTDCETAVGTPAEFKAPDPLPVDRLNQHERNLMEHTGFPAK